jgi:hypothetical protein
MIMGGLEGGGGERVSNAEGRGGWLT